MGNDLVVAVQSFFIKGFLPKGLNATILALIPETEAAGVMKDYQPISCCNLLYKVISKIRVNRFKSILPQFINLNRVCETTIVNGKCATCYGDGQDYHKEHISPRCAVKIDISKTFDSVQWEFVLNILSALNFPDIFIYWIRLCITTPSFSMQVNRELAELFRSKRRLRQGCALSPLSCV